MFRIRKSFKVPVGHRLMKHSGLCKNIHGHNLKIEVQLSCHGLDNNDMVMDFGRLSDYFSSLIVILDHSILLNSEDTKTISFSETCGDPGKKVITFENSDPTAEVLACYIYKQLIALIRANEKYINLDYVAVWESDDAVAIFDGCEKDVK